MYNAYSLRWQITLLLLLVALPLPAHAALKPASVFTDYMVLQREQPLRIWGTANPGVDVEVLFDRTKAQCTADSKGRWLATLGPLAANAVPQSLAIRSGDDTVTLTNLLVGDVWLCSGQSNMQMPLSDATGGPAFAKAHGNNPLIRLLLVPKLFAAEPSESQQGRWAAATPESAGEFSAVGFSFGASLSNSPAMQGIPIGLIDSSFGGTSIEGWLPASDLETFDRNILSKSMFGNPTEHYNAMINPLAPMAIRGVIWYQGESNSDQPAIYGKLLEAMILAWRREFRRADLPFIVVQLPAYNAPFQQRYFTWIREQQSLVAQRTPGVSLVVSYDTHDGTDLHPREKIPIGERAAIAARSAAHREAIVEHGPTYLSHVIDGAEAKITFDTLGAELTTSDKSGDVRGFQLAGSNEDYHFATGKILDRNTVAVSAPAVPSPKQIRFAWSAVPDANLANTAGLPAIPFRTDSRPPDDVEFIHVPTHRSVRTPVYELELDALGSLRSFGVGGEQFISNNLGVGGGSMIPTFFGPRNLNQVEEIGPNRLIFRDKDVAVKYYFDRNSVTIEVTNRTPDSLAYQIALAEGATTTGESAVLVKKGNASIHANGFEATPETNSKKPLLRLTVPGGKTRSAKLKPAG